MPTSHRILVTGASGFIGKAVVNHFKKQGYVIRLYFDKDTLWKKDGFDDFSSKPLNCYITKIDRTAVRSCGKSLNFTFFF